MSLEFSNLEKLQKASFRGVSFLVPQESVTRGQKVAVHEYPNRDERFVEPLGKVPPIMDLTCIVHSNISNDQLTSGNFIQNRENLERALEIPGIGELIHPVYGSMDVQVGEYSVSSNQTKVGEFVFNIKFYSSVAEITATALLSTAQVVTSVADTSRSFLLDVIGDGYIDPTDGIELTSAVDSMSDTLDSFKVSFDLIEGIESAVAELDSFISSFTDGLFEIMQTGASLKDSLTNLYNNLVQLTLDPATLFAAWNNLIDFGLTDDEKNGIRDASNIPALNQTTTTSRIIKETNKSLIKESTRLVALIGLYESSSSIDFSTVDDLDNVASNNNNAFNNNVENSPVVDPNITSLISDVGLFNSILDLKVNSQSTIDDQLSNIFRVIDINPGKSSMFLTTYRFYGSTDNLSNIIQLNPDVSVSNFNQQIQAVTK